MVSGPDGDLCSSSRELKEFDISCKNKEDVFAKHLTPLYFTAQN